MAAPSRAWHSGLRFAAAVRASIASLVYDAARYRRSACARRHRIAAAPSEVARSPGSAAIPTAQPSAQAPKRRAGCPRAVHDRTTPWTHETPSSAQIETSASSAAVGGRRAGAPAGGAQSWTRATSAEATTSMPSFTQPASQVVAGDHAHSQLPGCSRGAVHGYGTWPGSEVSTRPSTQRASPSEQSVPPRSNDGAPSRVAPPARAGFPSPPRPGDADRSSNQRMRQPRSHAETPIASDARTTPRTITRPIARGLLERQITGAARSLARGSRPHQGALPPRSGHR